MKKTITLLTLAFYLNTNAQIITTFAGNGTQGYLGDGGQATAAELYAPEGLAFDAAGNLIIADYSGNVVRMVNTAGIISTIAGTGYGASTLTGGYSGDGGQATDAELYFPEAVAVDALGNVYIADGNNRRIRMVNTAGIITTVVGNGSFGYSGDGGQATNASIKDIYGIGFDQIGNLYLTDALNHVVRKVNTTGIITTVVGNGTSGYSGDGGQATNAQLSAPSRLTFDVANNLYLADVDNNTVRKISPSGIITTIAGTGIQGFSGDGGQATAAEINNPDGVVLDASGNLYIATSGDNRVRMLNTAGIITTIAGGGTSGLGDGGPATAAELEYPVEVIFDSEGNLYISDNTGYRVRKITNVAVAGIERFTSNSEQVNIYPNPNNGSFVIELDNTTKQTMQVYDVNGKLVLSQIVTDKTSIDANILNEGVYNMSIISDKGIINKRLVIVR